MNKTVKKLLWIWMVSWIGILALVYAFDPMKPDLHRLCSWLPQHASWDTSSWNKSVVWSYLWDLLDVVVPDWVNIWWALTPRTNEWKTLCTFTCDFWYKLDSSNQTCVEDPDVNPCPTGYNWNNIVKKCDGDSPTQYPAYMISGYSYAHEIWIEDRTLDVADLYWTITKQELAKFIVLRWKNELNLENNASDSCNITDITDADWDYVEYIIEACEMWLMGSNNSEFHPYNIVSNAVFATTLSRAIWWDQYDWWEPYYSRHIAALKGAGIINNIEPEDEAIRWYIYAALYRAANLGNEPIETTLQNNITWSVKFKKNESTTKTVFDWVYIVWEDTNLNWWLIVKDGGDSEKEFKKDDVTFNLYLDWEEVSTLTPTGNLGFSNSFSGVNMKAWDSIVVKVTAEVDGETANTWTYQYSLWLFDLLNSSGVQLTVNLVSMVVEEVSNEVEISTDGKEKEVILADNNILLWDFHLSSANNGTEVTIENFSLEFDNEVDYENLMISIDWTELECEEAWTDNIWHQMVRCEDVDYNIKATWSSLKVELKNPETWKYRITLSWINWSSDFFSIIRFAVDPLFKLTYVSNDGSSTTYDVSIEWNKKDTISNLRFYTSAYDSVEAINSATPIITIPSDLTHGESIEVDNIWEDIAYVKTIAYDVDWETIVINKDDYLTYFIIDNAWNKLRINPES